MTATESQRAKILDWMLDGNRITPLEALRLFHCMRLGARIFELKENGVPIEDRYITVTDSDGKPTRVKEYWIDPGFFDFLDALEAEGRCLA